MMTGRPFRSIAASVIATLALAAQGLAQGTSPGPKPAGDSTPAAPPLGALKASNLSPGHWAYEIAANIGPQRRDAGTRVLTVEPATKKGQRAWLVIDTKMANGRMAQDSLYLSRETLTPLAQVVHLGDASVVSRFDHDSAFFNIQVDSQPRLFSMALPRGAMVNGAMLEMALRLQKFSPGWAGHVEMLAVSLSGGVTVPVDVHLEGEDIITVPAGTFHCWRFSQKHEGAEQRFWIDQKAHVLVKMSTTSTAVPGTVAEMTLTSQG